MQISTSVCTNYNKLKVVRKILLNKIEIIFNFFICFCVEPLSISPTSQLLLVTPPPLLFHSIFFGSPPPPLLKCHFFFSCPPPPQIPPAPPMLIKNERSLKANVSCIFCFRFARFYAAFTLPVFCARDVVSCAFCQLSAHAVL